MMEVLRRNSVDGKKGIFDADESEAAGKVTTETRRSVSAIVTSETAECLRIHKCNILPLLRRSTTFVEKLSLYARNKDEFMKFVDASKMFNSFSKLQLMFIGSRIEYGECKRGTSLWMKGEPAETAILLVSGRMQIDDGTELLDVRSGSMVVETRSMFENKSHTRHLVATTSATYFIMTFEKFLEIVTTYPGVLMSTMNSIVVH